MKLTPTILRAAYAYLRETEPFNRWKLPPPEHVRFKVSNMRDMYGSMEIGSAPPLITISSALTSHTYSLMTTMAHEMVHFLDMTHGENFQRKAAKVCKDHGFDPHRFL